MKTNLLRALAAAALLALSAPVWGQQAPAAAGAAETRTLVQQGKFDEALAILLPLVQAGAVDSNTLFLYGLAAVGAADRPGIPEKKRDALLDAGISVFHAMLVRRPGLVRVRLELGRAFFLKGEDSLARQNFEQVMASKPPAAVALNVNRFLIVTVGMRIAAHPPRRSGRGR